MNNTIKNALRGALFFGAIAPPIGSVVFSLGLIVGSIFSSSPTDFASLIFMSFFIAIFSYVFGLIPALISGFILGYFGGNFYSHKRKLLAATLCMSIASICGLIYIGAADS
jgi:ABC-type dipeptide/oligopeptide/nickel transport system permease component